MGASVKFHWQLIDVAATLLLYSKYPFANKDIAADAALDLICSAKFVYLWS